MGYTDSDRLLWLEALEAAGVDNWEGIDFAVELYNTWIEELKKEQENDNL